MVGSSGLSSEGETTVERDRKKKNSVKKISIEKKKKITKTIFTTFARRIGEDRCRRYRRLRCGQLAAVKKIACDPWK
jgi:hypothetical protein